MFLDVTVSCNSAITCNKAVERVNLPAGWFDTSDCLSDSMFKLGTWISHCSYQSRVSLFICAVCIGVSSASAQTSSTGAIIGVVIDPSGAAIAGCLCTFERGRDGKEEVHIEPTEGVCVSLRSTRDVSDTHKQGRLRKLCSSRRPGQRNRNSQAGTTFTARNAL
jgi:hypothetical protein